MKSLVMIMIPLVNAKESDLARLIGSTRLSRGYYFSDSVVTSSSVATALAPLTYPQVSKDKILTMVAGSVEIFASLRRALLELKESTTVGTLRSTMDSLFRSVSKLVMKTITQSYPQLLGRAVAEVKALESASKMILRDQRHCFLHVAVQIVDMVLSISTTIQYILEGAARLLSEEFNAFEYDKTALSAMSNLLTGSCETGYIVATEKEYQCSTKICRKILGGGPVGKNDYRSYVESHVAWIVTHSESMMDLILSPVLDVVSRKGYNEKTPRSASLEKTRNICAESAFNYNEAAPLVSESRQRLHDAQRATKWSTGTPIIPLVRRLLEVAADDRSFQQEHSRFRLHKRKLFRDLVGELLKDV